MFNGRPQRRPRRPHKRTQSPSWDTPVYRVVHMVNHEALRWQIAQSLADLAPYELNILKADPQMLSDPAIDIYIDKIYGRMNHPLPNNIEVNCPFDRAFDAELRRQVAALVNAGAIAA